MKSLRVGGLTPLTTIDYPDHLSCVIYCQGCSWRCQYCHNPELIECKKASQYSWEEILDFLHNRKGLLDAVVFSGGEPLLQKSLLECIQQVKKMGFKVGLHTGGSVPARFKAVLPYVDWVGFDIKGLSQSADQIIQIEGASAKNWKSLDYLLASDVDYSCRTTVHWELFTPEQLVDLAQALSSKGVLQYSLQFCRTKRMLSKGLSHSLIAPEKLSRLKLKLQEIIPSISFVSA